MESIFIMIINKNTNNIVPRKEYATNQTLVEFLFNLWYFVILAVKWISFINFSVPNFDSEINSLFES